MLEDQLERQESYRRFVYDDATGQEIVPGYTVQGNPTIGYGRDLMTEGISKEEAMVLLRHDIDRAWREVTSHLPWAESQLSVIRFAVLVNMAFNMGLQGLLGFTQMLSALQAGNYEQAAKAMLDSLWYQQTEGRAQALAEQKIGYLDDAKKNTTFRYDGLNRRAVMVEMNGSDNQTTTFLWDGTDLLVAKTGNLLKRYYPQGELHGNEKLFYVSDRLGSVRETVNQDCLITARMRYSAYGMTRTELPIFIGKTPDYRYAGLFFHEQSGLYLAVFRLYDPTSGRWISRDPIGEEGGINLFSYADNSPVTETDVAGLFSWSQINSSILDITGGCSESKRHFVGDVARNFIAVEKFSLLRLGVSLALSGKVADTYGGLTIGRALVEYYKETKTGLKVVSIGYRSFGQVAGTVAATTAFDSVLINGMYYAGALIGSVLRVAVNRVAASSCECSS